MAAPSKTLEFPGQAGHTLAGRLELPSGAPRAYALFAHCFTCSKDSHAAARISRLLAEHGIAVLRFDFTGLGDSEGELANSGFSSNVQDLIAAADYLRVHHEAPRLLIGHSLGGAAVLAAAGDIPEVLGVATINAPADATHVLRHFQAKVEEIEQRGVGEVTLGGRRFQISKRFLDDVRSQRLTERISRLHRSLLVFHAPRDEIVGIDNATAIFVAAKHPKSFVSLDDADHLLTRRQDAAYVAEMLSAWASRFVADRNGDGTGTSAPAPAGVVMVGETGEGKFQQLMRVGTHRILADEPRSVGGSDTGPSPYDLLAMALGACTTMTLRLYADKKQIPLDRVSVDVKHRKVHAEDCEDCGEGREGRIDRFERIIRIEGALDAATRARLLEIADRCPVHRTLEASSVIVTRSVET
ncbi:MAG: OsmC family protein [Hyphomicrobiaceae bacterium]|nr:OsmC family protein [Hyphomicrobiaceae bacterium]